MRIYPAIDIIGGKCVRLSQGRFDEVVVFNEDPAAAAKEWASAGASVIHAVDLDGARGEGGNLSAIAAICAAAGGVPVQVGGGVRSLEDVEGKLSAGASRVIIGTAAIDDPGFVERAVREYGEKIAVGIDASNGRVAIRGWKEISSVGAVDLAVKMEKIGVRTIIYTDISKDGMMSGPNISATKELINSVNVDIIASGGISSAKDLEGLAAIGAEGAVVGKALYLGALDLREIIEWFEVKHVYETDHPLP